MKVKFNKDVAVDFEVARLAEITDKSFRRNQIVEVTSVENNGAFVNLHFDNGDLAIDIPSQAISLV